jgi:arsenate reductase-like glutaredoxin family protein
LKNFIHKNRSFNILKNKIIEKLKDNLSNKMNYINNVIEKDIDNERLKEKPKGFLKSTIANYKNKDTNLNYTIMKILSFTMPFILFFSAISMAMTMNSLINSIIFSILGISFTTLLTFITFSENEKVTISEQKISEINLMKEKLNKIIKEKNNKIEHIFDNESKKRFEEDFSIKYKDLNLEQISLFNDNIDVEIFNMLKNNFSKGELISLLSNVKNKEITYNILIEFIDNIERADKAETLYDAMFEIKSELKNKEITMA